jgi:hypothetical protein
MLLGERVSTGTALVGVANGLEGLLVSGSRREGKGGGVDGAPCEAIGMAEKEGVSFVSGGGGGRGAALGGEPKSTSSDAGGSRLGPGAAGIRVVFDAAPISKPVTSSCTS